MGLADLRLRYPFPADVDSSRRKLTADGLPVGWACADMRAAIARYGATAEVVIDGGSFQGRSATHFIRTTPAQVICIDHWQGSPEHQKREDVGELYPIFLANMAEHAARIVPLRMSSVEGLRTVAAFEVRPAVILIDWAHDRVSVASDVGEALRLFPAATLILDDWRNKRVREGAHAGAPGRRIIELNKIAVIKGIGEP